MKVALARLLDVPIVTKSWLFVLCEIGDGEAWLFCMSKGVGV